MKTITFYSYKGGVGRSLALSRMAMRLSQLRKKVCVIDFDLDAPGLRFKFLKDYKLNKDIIKGIVDYIYDFSVNGILHADITEYSSELISQTTGPANINFISAGDINSSEYWKKLALINWAEMFYSKEGKGVKFFLDLKAKIESEISPDYLLIDSRTGITDISGITIRILADEIVVLAVNNKENIWGTKKIIKSINRDADVFEKNLQVRFVLTRLPFAEKIQEKEKEYNLIESIKKEFQEDLSISDFDISIIHTDRELEEKEALMLGTSKHEKSLINFKNEEDRVSNILSKDYLNLFNKITEGDRFDEQDNMSIQAAETEYLNAINQKSITEKLRHLNQAIALNNQNPKYYSERATLFWSLGDINKAIEDYLAMLSLRADDLVANYALGLLYLKIENFTDAEIQFDKVVEKIPQAAQYKVFAMDRLDRNVEALTFINEFLEKNPDVDSALNARANLYRGFGRYNDGIQDIYKAIEMNPNEPLYIGTLAELRAALEDVEGFYLSLTMALSKGLSADQMQSARGIYERFKNEKRFINLMEKYQLDLGEIFK